MILFFYFFWFVFIFGSAEVGLRGRKNFRASSDERELPDVLLL